MSAARRRWGKYFATLSSSESFPSCSSISSAAAVNCFEMEPDGVAGVDVGRAPGGDIGHPERLRKRELAILHDCDRDARRAALFEGGTDLLRELRIEAGGLLSPCRAGNDQRREKTDLHT